MIAEGVEHIVFHDFSEQDDWGKLPGVSSGTGQSFDLNSEPIGVDGLYGEVSARMEESDGPMREEEIGKEYKGMEDDLF